VRFVRRTDAGGGDGGRRIALIGSVNRDTITTPDGVKTESYGGMLYSLLSMASIAPAALYPICNLVLTWSLRCAAPGAAAIHPVGRHPDRAGEESALFPGVRCPGPEAGDAAGRVPALALDRIEPFLNCDALCVNFINRMELELKTLSRQCAPAPGAR